MANVRIIDQTEITTLSGDEYLVTDSSTEGTKKITPQNLVAAVGVSGSGLTNDIKVALLECFEKVAWIDENGQEYYDALYDALYPDASVASITAVFTQGQAVIYDTDSLDTLRQYLVVTAFYDDSTSEVVTNYTLSGTLTAGTSTITARYMNKTDTFTVTVSERWTYSISDLVRANGPLVTAEGADCKRAIAETTNYRYTFARSSGATSFAIQRNHAITSQTSDYYPVKIPAGATGVTVTITPSTQYVAAYVIALTDGEYDYTGTATGDSGYVQGSHTKAFAEAGDNWYLGICTKYNDAGTSYPTAPTGIDVVFS